MYRTSACACARILGSCALAALIGCFPEDLGTDPSWPEQVLSATPSLPTGGETPEEPAGTDPDPQDSTSSDPPSGTHVRHEESEPNDTWDAAEQVAFAGSAELAGTLAAGTGVKDVDLFNLGPASAGYRLQAELQFSGGTDVQLGLFDELGRIVAYIDPISPTSGPDHVDIVLNETTRALYAMVTTRSSSGSVRSYVASITLQQISATSARPQVVILVFQGADQVQIGSRPSVDIPPFDIGTVNGAFAGRTEEAIQLLMQKVQEDYDGLNVDIRRDADLAIPPGQHTYIYFGTSDTRLLGLADNIDPYNSDPAQRAIIYTDTFSLFNQLNPGFEATVQVLANVASHETGHLLGLRHTADPEELMDVTATARQMLKDQWFKTSNLHISVLPAGIQDAPAMLAWSVGGLLKPTTTAKLYAAARIVTEEPGEPDFYIPRSWLGDCGCTECELQTGEQVSETAIGG